PLNYKRRGLAVILVFFLMGVLMIAGSYYASSGRWDPRAAWLSVPVSALVSLLLVSNEMRDWEDDTRHGIRTLTVRVGYDRGVRIYWSLVALAYGSALVLWLRGLLPLPWPLLLSLPALRAPLRLLHAPPSARRPLPPLTARFHLVFGGLYVVTCVM
ncbi:MAG TPA: prenyltransferase, partial [Gemmatimonadaceae bacterium]|nr:prenyltransferase [Gemmatimonadaceae bacterium]